MVWSLPAQCLKQVLILDHKFSQVQASNSECRSTHQGYAMALALQAVQNIAGRAPVAWLTAVDVSLVLTCANEAPDGAVRNAALSLLEVLTLKLPDTTLQHVLQVSQCYRGNDWCC